MLQSYLAINFLTLMILIATLTMMQVNKDVKIPATKLFLVSIALMFVLTIAAVFDNDVEVTGLSAAEAARIIGTRKIACIVGYIVRPCVILTEVLIILQNKKNKILCVIPAIVNAAIYLTALTGSRLAFYIDEENLWHGGPLKLTIYITQFIYLLMLLNSSVYSFKSGDKRKSLLLLVMLIQAVLVAIQEYISDAPHGHSDEIMALCMLEYYIYLTNVYRQELNDKLDAYVDEIEKAGVRLKSLTGEVIEALASAIDAKDKYTHGHSSRVAEYSRKLAEMNGKTEQECDEVYYAALLHDVGKIGISDSIITKEGKLTDDEYAEIKKHPVLGMNILHRISEFPYLAVGAAGHHERYDGRGYPYGLKGTDIPELARIIAVADAYDAMSSKRSYRDPIPQEKVREEIVKGIGTQFDPDYALLMLKLIDEDKDYKMREHKEPTNIYS
ncbi:MAG: HD-GYP domain-containing protein [Butyrivibrio sp.]|nr:HD-GYP domain-containing protein [Butyrivibrio sp.]